MTAAFGADSILRCIGLLFEFRNKPFKTGAACATCSCASWTLYQCHVKAWCHAMGNRANTNTVPMNKIRVDVALALGPLLMRFGAAYGCTGGPRLGPCLGGPVPKGAKGSNLAAFSLQWSSLLLSGDGDDCIMVFWVTKGRAFWLVCVPGTASFHFHRESREFVCCCWG